MSSPAQPRPLSHFLHILSHRTLLVARKIRFSCPKHKEKLILHTHTHTHPFNGPLSGTTRVGPYQKGKNHLDFTEARDSEWQWHQLGHMQVCTLLQTDNHTSTPPLSFLHAGCPSCRPTNSVRALKAYFMQSEVNNSYSFLSHHFRGLGLLNWV